MTDCVIVISDTEEEEHGAKKAETSPLTAVKSRNPGGLKKLTKTKQISKKSNELRKQTKLDRYIKNVQLNRHNKPVTNENIVTPTCNPKSKSAVLKDVRLSPLRTASAAKRSAEKGLSPKAKLPNSTSRRKPLSQLKGDELWKAVVAQRKKSLEPLFSNPLIDNGVEDLLMTEKVVHSYPNEKPKYKPVVDETTNDVPCNTCESSPPRGKPIFRPKQKFIIKKKVKDDIKFDDNIDSPCLKTSTPTKDGKLGAVPEMDGFSDESFNINESKLEPTDKRSALIDNYNRHLVLDCSPSELNTIMLLKDMAGSVKTCELRGFWADVQIKNGDVVNIIGEFDENSYIKIDMVNSNSLVVNPDFLVSGSTIASSTQCVRRSVLNARYRGYEGTNTYMLLGSILHEIFQKVLTCDARSEAEIMKIARETALTSGYAHDMYSTEMTEKSLLDSISEYVPSMLSFVRKNVGKRAQGNIKIRKVIDIEETVWSPRFGMKGKVDVTVEVEKNGKQHVAPLELKTGRATYSAEHKGQVTMYAMMLNERLNKINCHEAATPGLLVYLKDGTMQEVKNSNAAIKGLINLRNELSKGLLLGVTANEQSTDGTMPQIDPLPEPINQLRICSKCPQLLSCTLHQRVFKDFDPASDHIMAEMIPEMLSHLSDSHLEYFRKWVSMILLESSRDRKWENVSDIWCKNPSLREEAGTCISCLTLQLTSDQSQSSYSHVLVRSQPISTDNSRLDSGSNVIISEQTDYCAVVATGQITSVSPTNVVLSCDRKLASQVDYCLDLNEYYSSDGTSFTNMAKLMENTPQSLHMRSLVVDGEVPNFVEDDECDFSGLNDILSRLNPDQKYAVRQALRAKDYLVIKGYPGTGKTTTISALVAAFRRLGLSVLIASYTNSAVDNILLKLKKENVEFLRIGRLSRIHPDIAGNSAANLTSDITCVDQLSRFYNSYHVVGLTCLSTSHPMLMKRKFDVCIIDEASQILQPVCLGPLFYSKKFIIVGDENQLPPLVRSPHAKSLGMDRTLLDVLDAEPGCVELSYQYRMNDVLMKLPNHLVYNNRLKCGSPHIALSTISIKEETTNLWDQKVVSSDLANSVVFLNTSMCAFSPMKKTTSHSNTEAHLVGYICRKLVKRGVDENLIGVITPYQAQVQLLRRFLNDIEVEVNTVDQYQGRDKSVIIISFAKTTLTCNRGPVSGILSDMRRLNVAITRAKHKLIMIGNCDVISRYDSVNRLVKTLDPQQIIQVPHDWRTPDT